MQKKHNHHIHLMIFILCVGIITAHAEWIDNGNPVCDQPGVQRAPAVALGSGNEALIVWEDSRGGDRDIYIQRSTPDGVSDWPLDGIAVCSASGDQWTPAVVSDGEGGAIVIWADTRSGDFDLYGQRIDSSGSPLWGNDGMSICQLDKEQWNPRLVADGSGGAIVSWVDGRSSDYDIYAQRIDPAGVKLWPGNGISICGIAGRQDYMEMITDGEGGAVFTWEDRRHGPRDIFAQRIDGEGTLLWQNGGISVCDASGNQYTPRLVGDYTGGAVISWVDQRNGSSELFAQRIDATGNTVWTSNGKAVCSNGNGLDSPKLINDGDRGVIVSWEDRRYGHRDIFAQKIDTSGVFAWPGNGLVVCTAADQQWAPQIVPDLQGGAIVCWYDYRSGTDYDIYTQKINSDGIIQWEWEGEAVCIAPGNQWIHSACPDGNGGIYIVWEDDRGGDIDLYSQRIDTGGNVSVATLLQGFILKSYPGEIRLEWSLSEIDEDVEFDVQRMDGPAGIFEVVWSGTIQGNDLNQTFIDRDCRPDETYRYRVYYKLKGDETLLFETGSVSMPQAKAELAQNFPNPFNPSTEVRYYLPETCLVQLDVYDVAGRHIIRLADGMAEPGNHRVLWNGLNSRGNPVSSGVYIYRMRAGKTIQSRKMIVSR